MKNNFKTLIIVFLVGLLGSGLGTFGMMELYQRSNGSVAGGNTDVVINEVEYANIERNDFTLAVEKAYNTVVEITCKVQTASSGFFFGGTSESTSAGSGVIFTQDGYIVTNEHVIEGLVDENSISIKLYTGDVYNAKVIGFDKRTDIAVLKIEAQGLPYASFVDSSKLLLGQDVIAIGNPLGLGITVSDGIISALEKEIYVNDVYMTVIQTNAAVNEGNSGGGLFDANGDLVGIVNAKKGSSFTTTVEGMNYAIPANTVSRIVTDILENGYVKDRAALGIKVYTSSSYYSTNGVVVSSVIEGGSAEKAGIKEYDVIVAIDDQKVSSYADLSKFLDSKQIGDTVEVTIIRDDSEIKLPVTLQASSR